MPIVKKDSRRICIFPLILNNNIKILTITYHVTRLIRSYLLTFQINKSENI